MDKKTNKKNLAKSSLGILVASSLMAALSIVLGKYLAIPVGDVLRFSFENLPVMMAGMAFGPIVGALVGTVADLIGCLLVGYAINPLVTVGAATVGFLSGLAYTLLSNVKIPHALRVTLSILPAHLIGSVIIKTVGLSIFYSMPIWALMLWRLLNYLIIGVPEGIILWYLMKNKLILHRINSIKDVGKERSDDKDEL